MIKNKTYRKIEPSGYSRTYHITNCVKCEKELHIASGNLKRHQGHCTSCQYGTEEYESLYRNLKRNAKRRNIKLDLTFREFLFFVKKTECHYCEGPINFSKRIGPNSTYGYNLDRKNPQVGYNLINCVVCCAECNRVKSNKYSYSEFKQIAKLLKQLRENRNE